MPVATGSRIQVMNGTALHTSGGLTKSDLKRKTVGKGANAQTRIVSKAASANAKRNVPPQLKIWRDALKSTGVQRKGEFTPIKRGTAMYKKVRADYERRLAKAGY